MIFDYIPIPWLLTWIEWNLYAHKYALFNSLLLSVFHYWFTVQTLTWPGMFLALFIGFCLWVVICAFIQGYAVG